MRGTEADWVRQALPTSGSLAGMRRAIRRFDAALLAVLTAGCASSVTRVDGVFQHRRHGYAIAAPADAWRQVKVAHATLAFARGDAESMSLKSRCGRPVARAELMARHLLIRLKPRDVIASRPIQVAGRSGWLQVVDTAVEGRPVRLKTVTLVVGDCSFDWVLASSGNFESAEAEFDAWWQSLRLDAADQGEGNA